MSAFASPGALYSAIVGASQLVQFADPLGNTIVQFDACVSESYAYDAKPTEFPVEDGSSIADHIVRSPMTLDITGIVTDTPIAGLSSLAKEAATVAASAVLPPLGFLAASTAYATWQAHSGSNSPSHAAYAAIIKLMIGEPSARPPVAPEPFTVVTRLGTFDNMVLTSLSVPRDAETGAALIFQCKLQVLDVVESQTIDVTVLDQPGLAAMKDNVGEQQGEQLNGTFLPGFRAGQADTNALLGAP